MKASTESAWFHCHRDVLDGGYWHCATAALHRILRAGFILPNLGRFRPNHRLSITSRTYQAGGVSLFEPLATSRGSWLLTWLTTHKPIAIGIRLDPVKIALKALSRERLTQSPGGIMLRGEVCYPGPIPMEWCTGYLLVPSEDPHHSRWIEGRACNEVAAALRAMRAALQKKPHKDAMTQMTA